MRHGHTLLEMITATAVLATILVVVSQSITGGNGMRDTIASRGASDDQVNALVKSVTQDLRYSDINMIYLDSNNSPTWYLSGSTGDFYSFKVCTGFDTTATSVTAMNQLVKYERGVVLRFSRNSDDTNKGTLSRTVYSLAADGTSTGVIEPETPLCRDIAWSYLANPDETEPTKGFSISQLSTGSGTVIGNRLGVSVAVRPSTVTQIAETNGVPESTPVSVTTSAVFLRSTLFDQFGTLPPEISSSLTATGHVGSTFRYDIIASNFPSSYVANPLPAGVTLDFTHGIISGTPTTSGTYQVALSATNQAGTDSKVLTVTVGGPIPEINSSIYFNVIRSEATSYQITATNTPTSFDASDLPPGLSVSSATGAISGTTNSIGSWPVVLTATNANGSGTATATFTVTDAPLPAPVISNPATSYATIGQAFSLQVQAANSPTDFAASGLPSGLSISPTTGLISGTASSSFDGTISLTATNASGSGTGSFRLIVQAPIPVVTSTTVSGVVGTALTYQITATNAPTAYHADSRPTWLSAPSNSGVMSGTPTASGVFTVPLQADNAYGTGNGTLTMSIDPQPAPAITSGSSVTGQATVTFSYKITASNSPTSYSASGLPTWLSVSTTTGDMSGIPTAQGTWTIIVAASNAAGTGTQNVTIAIGAAPEPPALSLNANSGNGNNFQVTGSIAAKPGYPVNYSSFAWSASQSGYSIRRGWVASEVGNGNNALASNEFVISGNDPSGLLTLTVSVADTGGRTGSTSRSY